MTLYQQLNTIERRMRTELKNTKGKDRKAVENKYVKEFEDILYNLIVYCMNNNITFICKADANDNGDIENFTYYEYDIPYCKSYITLVSRTGNLFIEDNGSYASDNMLRIELLTSNFSGMSITEEAARDVMNNIYNKIAKDDNLNAWLLLQGINAKDVFLIDIPYMEPKKKPNKKYSKREIIITW